MAASIITQRLEHQFPLDLNTVFSMRGEAEGARQRFLNAMSAVFADYAHLLDQDDSWVRSNWAHTLALGYAAPDLIDAGNGLRTALALEAPLIQSLQQADKASFVQLYSSSGWNMGRQHGASIKHALGAAADWEGFDEHKDEYLGKMNAILADLALLPDDPLDSLDEAYRVACDRNMLHPAYTDSTLLFHLVWPQAFPVWYRANEDGSVNQVEGIERLLDQVADRTGWTRQPMDIVKNYADYSAAYRLLLAGFDAFLKTRPELTPPHFDFLTEMLSMLQPQADALALLRANRALILDGVPGTGKTFTAQRLVAPAMGSPEHPARVATVQFHPGYSYADFVIGIRPVTHDKDVTYPTLPGLLYRAAAEAVAQPDVPHVLIIDEINRADLAKVLGETMYLLEYRGQAHGITLPHQLMTDEIEGVFDRSARHADPFEGGKRFYLPENLYFIGTMNHADRSIGSFDAALRRRFRWYRMDFSRQALRSMLSVRSDAGDLETIVPMFGNGEAFITRCVGLNRRIADQEGAEGGERAQLGLGSHHVLGHAFFAAITEFKTDATSLSDQLQRPRITAAMLERLWLYVLRPQIEDGLGYEAQAYDEALTRLGRWFCKPL